MDQEQLNYSRIAQAIEYIKQHFTEQPSLDEIAKEVGISAYHFQRLFSQWAGVSPKKFMQYLSVEYAKKILKYQRSTLLETAYQTGLSGTGRLHDLFVNIEGMTPGEYKSGGAALQINYSYANTQFGKVIVASTPKGICHLFFEHNEEKALVDLVQRFPQAIYHHCTDQFHQDALLIFRQQWRQLDQVKLHLRGTMFQLKVWQALLTISEGELTSYRKIAEHIHQPRAARAVATAIGNNIVAFLIPCHRVIRADGQVAGYRWGEVRKSAIIGWEASQRQQ